MKTSALVTKKSSRCRVSCGNGHQPSEQVVVLPLTLTGADCSPQAVKAVLAVLVALLDNTLSPDVMFLAMHQARDIAAKAGVSPEEFERTSRLISAWSKERRKGNVMQRWFDGSKSEWP